MPSAMMLPGSTTGTRAPGYGLAAPATTWTTSPPRSTFATKSLSAFGCAPNSRTSPTMTSPSSTPNLSTPSTSWLCREMVSTSSSTGRSKSTYSRSQLNGTRKCLAFLELELPQEAQVALEEEPEIRDAVLDHRHPIRAEPESETGVLLRVVADLLEHGRVHHPGATRLEPAGALAHLAVGVLAVADKATHVHLDARLGELEVARPQP